MKTLILGLGNPILSNDRIGLEVAGELFKRFKNKKDMFLRKTALSGPNLLGLVTSYERVIMIDSVIVEDKDLGKCFKIEIGNKNYSPRSYHRTSIFQILNFAKKMGLDLPKNLEVYAIGISPTNGISKRTGRQLKSRISVIVDEIYEDLRCA